MKLIDKLQSLSRARLLSEAEMGHLVKMHSLYRIGAITYNDLRIGLGGESVGTAGDQYVSEDQKVVNYRFWRSNNIGVAGDRLGTIQSRSDSCLEK